MDNLNCEFCKIVEGKSPETTLEFENDDIVIFKDIKPASDHHYLAVPKKHIVNIKCLNANDVQLLENLEKELRTLMASKGVDMTDVQCGFHWPPFNTVHHLHLHGIGPASKMRGFAKWVFKSETLWFTSFEYAKNWIMRKK